MRNKNKIDAIITELEKVWLEYPDLRLGQLILNIEKDPKIYYMEDEELIERLKEFYKVN